MIVEPAAILHSAIHHDLLRKWQCKFKLTPENLMYPVFVTDSSDIEPIASMPEQSRVPLSMLEAFIADLVRRGLKSVLLFGVLSNPDHKDERGTLADSPECLVVQAVKICRKFDLVVACDVCLCPYTSHGHCGLFGQDGTLCNDSSIERLAQVAGEYAKAGAHIVAPSDMMDGRVLAIKQKLQKLNLASCVSVMSYSAKFASAFYGPFRDAAKSSPSFGDRKCYQLPPGSRGLARRAIIRDMKEGADMIMVKPGYPYLDVVKEASELAADYPIAVYQVSGEYSMLYQAGKGGLVNMEAAVLESIEAYMRAGANIIISYFTPMLLDMLSRDETKDAQQ